MSVFVKFEEEVIDKLVLGTLTPELVSSLKRDRSLVSYEYSGYGYFLKVVHPLLPESRIVCSQPEVTGTAGDILASFVIFIGNHQFTFEAFPVDGNSLPPNFRELDVHISHLDRRLERIS